MPVPLWFDYQVYMENKLEQMQTSRSDYSMDKLVAAFEKAGFAGEEGAFRHFQKWGHFEDVSPNALFDADYYYQSKALDFYMQKGLSEDEIRSDMETYAGSIRKAIADAGMDAWTHYIRYGTAEGIDPSETFSTNSYMNLKLDALQASDPDHGWTRAEMLAAFAKAGLNALEHAVQYGTDAADPRNGECIFWQDSAHTVPVDVNNEPLLPDDEGNGQDSGDAWPYADDAFFIVGFEGKNFIFDDAADGTWIYTGNDVIDAEKSSTDSSDDEMCWAAACSNMLTWTGLSGFKDEDATMRYFVTHFDNQPKSFIDGMSEYFDSVNLDSSQYVDGYLLPQIEENIMNSVVSLLSSGYAVGMSVSGSYGTHALTVWGASWNDEAYTGILVTDSDDQQVSDPACAPNSLRLAHLDASVENGSFGPYIDYVLEQYGRIDEIFYLGSSTIDADMQGA